MKITIQDFKPKVKPDIIPSINGVENNPIISSSIEPYKCLVIQMIAMYSLIDILQEII